MDENASTQSFLHDIKLDGMSPSVEFDKPAIDGRGGVKSVLLNQGGDCGFNPFDGGVFAAENLNARFVSAVRTLLGNGDDKNQGWFRLAHVNTRDRGAGQRCLSAACHEREYQVAL